MRKLVLPKYFGRPSIGLALFGCTNRPFYQICVFPDRALGRRSESSILEQASRLYLVDIYGVDCKEYSQTGKCNQLSILWMYVSHFQVGTFDPLPNVRNEKLVALNIGRIKYWIGERNAHISVPVLELLGLSGLFPIHPKTFIRARDNRRLASEAAAAQKAKEQEEKEKEEQQKAKEFLERQQLTGEQGEGESETSSGESEKGVGDSERRLESSRTEHSKEVASEGVAKVTKESSEAQAKASAASSNDPDGIKSKEKEEHSTGKAEEKRKD
ncbi:unnamed protein product [Anisakis simplex]|uniref:Small ribosomal subunit protein bS16m n=1 Tax=Anisakis simplex TaxID=6269 RepID=A0A0M3K5T3_ANISI|nr:unnamed protein product [Anisakis simplex]